MPSDEREAREGSSGGAHARHPPEEQGGGVERETREASAERYFSVRWMLERERAVEASDDCSSAFAIIPVFGVCLLTLYVIWLDHASQGLAAWLAGGSPLAEFLSTKLLSGQGLLQNWGMVDGEDELPLPWAYA